MADDDGVTSTSDPVVTTAVSMSPTNELDLKNDIQVEEDVGQSAIQGYLVSPSLANPTLQSLLTAPVSLQNGQLMGGDGGIQIVTIQSSPTDLLPAHLDANGKIWHVINPATLIAVDDSTDFKPVSIVAGDTIDDVGAVGSELIDAETVASVLMPPPPIPTQKLPPGCPSWAARMKNCEKIGDYYRGYIDTEVELDLLLTYHKQQTQSYWGTRQSPSPAKPSTRLMWKSQYKIGDYYRGYIDTEVELDLLLTYHKQQTQSFWGTRQSPSPAKPSTRLMWKSQYVPFDGVPFINSGSRAVVMECQYGPRRKGTLLKKGTDDLIAIKGEYKQTCPARIYIKKVRKFPEYAVDIHMEKRGLKNAMDKAFHELKSAKLDVIGQERFYVQLPVEKAHEFHDEKASPPPTLHFSDPYQPVPIIPPAPEPETPPEPPDNGQDKGAGRLHPKVINKIREIVAAGEVRVYAVRRQLRGYVTRELCQGSETSLQRHDLTLFPTVHDLKNQIHQAIKDIENGTLPLTASTVNVELLGNNTDNIMNMEQNLWQQNVGATPAVPETVTVTLTQNPGEDGSHVISRIETHLSDGTTQISTSLTPETAQLLARLNPSMFPMGSLVQLQNGTEDPGEKVPDNSMDLSDPKVENMDNETDPSMDIQETGEDKYRLSLQVSQEAEQSDETIRVLEADSSEASDMITQENHSISNQSEDLISVALVSNVDHHPSIEDVLNHESSDDDL